MKEVFLDQFKQIVIAKTEEEKIICASCGEEIKDRGYIVARPLDITLVCCQRCHEKGFDLSMRALALYPYHDEVEVGMFRVQNEDEDFFKQNGVDEE